MNTTSSYTRNLEALALVKALQDELREHGINTVLAGGAVRDIIHGSIPKDYDLIVLGPGDIQVASDASLLLARSVIPFHYSASFVQGALPGKLDWVLKAYIADIEVDIIRHNREYSSAKDAVEGFDCTLNMAWYDSTSDVVVRHPRYPEYGGRVFLTEYCDDPERRTKYLSAKYPEYQWPSHEEIQFHPNYKGARC